MHFIKDNKKLQGKLADCMVLSTCNLMEKKNFLDEITLSLLKMRNVKNVFHLAFGANMNRLSRMLLLVPSQGF